MLRHCGDESVSTRFDSPVVTMAGDSILETLVGLDPRRVLKQGLRVDTLVEAEASSLRIEPRNACPYVVSRLASIYDHLPISEHSVSWSQALECS